MNGAPPATTVLVARLDALERVLCLVDDRVDLCEQDLDCHRNGSLAAAIGDLALGLADLRARVDEWAVAAPTRVGAVCAAKPADPPGRAARARNAAQRALRVRHGRRWPSRKRRAARKHG